LWLVSKGAVVIGMRLHAGTLSTVWGFGWGAFGSIPTALGQLSLMLRQLKLSRIPTPLGLFRSESIEAIPNKTLVVTIT